MPPVAKKNHRAVLYSAPAQLPLHTRRCTRAARLLSHVPSASSYRSVSLVAVSIDCPRD